MIILFMAGIAILRRTFENSVNVALCTGHVDVSAGQLESRQIMVECSVRPITCVMTGTTIRTKLAVVMIVLFMARIAILRRTFENAIHVALSAGNIYVRTCQLEGSQVVIECSILPISCIMASTAIRTELTVMMIVLFMAGITILWCTLEDAVDMTTCTGHADVCTGQFESRQIMIKGSRFPCRRIMAGTAAGSKLTIVCIVLFMA